MSNPLSSFIHFLRQHLTASNEHLAEAEQHLSDAMKAEVDAVEARIEAKFEGWKADVMASLDARLNGSAEKAHSPAA